MREDGCQAVVWQTAINPVVAMELLAEGVWSGAGVLGPEALRRRAVPRRCWPSYGSPHGVDERDPADPLVRRSWGGRRGRRLASMSTDTHRQQTRLHGGRLIARRLKAHGVTQALHALRRPHLLDLRRLPRGGHRHRRRPPRADRGVRGRGLGEGHARSPASPR